MSVTPFSLSVFRSLFEGVAEEMGTALARSAFSPNIRERLDFSCALFDAAGRLVAQAAHIPVHLGSMPMLVVRIAARASRPGDVFAANDPFSGGTHLPDITLVKPLFVGRELVGYGAARAHHADVGGMAPGSMPVSREIFQEGLIIPVIRLYRRGRPDPDLWNLILSNVRTPREREGDLLAQLAACHIAETRLGELHERYGAAGVAEHMAALLDYSEELTKAALGRLPAGSAEHEDFLEFEGQLYPVRVKVTLDGARALADFTGSAPTVPGCLNAPLPVTCAAVYYCFGCLFGRSIPANDGAFRPLEIVAPPASIVNAAAPAAVVAGNVETSQRIVDTVFGALARLLPGTLPAASAGTMNNLAIGGVADGKPFAYYETMGGGCGGGPHGGGTSAIQVHMTNTRNTPAEALETETPLRVLRYALREGSGGAGRHPGGDGIHRELELLADAQVSLLAQRRLTRPPGVEGGRPGAPGRDRLLRPGQEPVDLPGQFTRQFRRHDVLSIETPGGGGFGAPGL